MINPFTAIGEQLVRFRSANLPASRARAIPEWALWLAVDPDGAVYVYDNAPHWTGWTWRWCHGARYARVCAETLDVDKLRANRLPHLGNGELYLLVEPVAQYVKPASTRDETALLVAACLACIAIGLVLL